MWRLSRYWIEDPAVQESIQEGLCQYWIDNANSTDLATTWDEFMAWSHGAYISSISVARRTSTQTLDELEEEVGGKEASYVANPIPNAYGDWQFTMKKLSLHRVDTIHKSMLDSAQRIFEHGNKNGRMLVWLAKGQFAMMYISGVTDVTGELLRSPSVLLLSINHRFLRYYRQLYSSRVAYTTNDLYTYLDRIAFPRLDSTDRNSLEQDISLEEVQLAMTQLKPGKTPGTDGLPTEFYPQHLELLTSLFHQFFSKGKLPDSMLEAVVVLVPKPRRNPEECSSYRPISLLKCGCKNFTN